MVTAPIVMALNSLFTGTFSKYIKQYSVADSNNFADKKHSG
jgi:hypothetical protein